MKDEGSREKGEGEELSGTGLHIGDLLHLTRLTTLTAFTALTASLGAECARDEGKTQPRVHRLINRARICSACCHVPSRWIRHPC